MDMLLKPIVRTFPQILLNTTQLLVEIETLELPDNSLLASLDVTALYPSIPTEEAINTQRRRNRSGWSGFGRTTIS